MHDEGLQSRGDDLHAGADHLDGGNMLNKDTC
jgi:hypothetical protein